VHVFVSGGKEFAAEKLLVSIGRQYNTEDIGLEALGIKKGERGEISVDDRMETNVKGIMPSEMWWEVCFSPMWHRRKAWSLLLMRAEQL